MISPCITKIVGHAPRARAHRLEDRDVAVLLHDQQDQRRDDVERGDHHDEPDGQRDGDLLERQRLRRATGSCRSSPAARYWSPETRGDRLRDLRRREDVVDAQLDQVDLSLPNSRLATSSDDEAGSVESSS